VRFILTVIAVMFALDEVWGALVAGLANPHSVAQADRSVHERSNYWALHGLFLAGCLTAAGLVAKTERRVQRAADAPPVNYTAIQVESLLL